MPRFLYTVVTANIVLWWLWINRFLNTAPTSTSNKIWFIFLFVLAAGTTASLPIYFWLHKKAPTLSNLKNLYRKSFKISIYFMSGVGVLMFLKLFQLFNFINVLLVLALYGTVYFQVLKNRRF